MIKFVELVVRTNARLLEKRSRDRIEIDTIRSFLSQVGIAQQLQRVSVDEVPPRVLIRRVRISGRKLVSGHDATEQFCYDRTLLPGLNGWIAGNGAGKSTVLKVIAWGITGVEPIFKPDVRTWIEDAFIEIAIADRTYTIYYAPHSGQPKVNGNIYAHDLETILNGSEALRIIEAFSGSSAMTEAIARFFSAQLRYASIKWVQPVRFSIDLEEKTISWEVYSQAFFIGADDYTDYLFSQRSLNGKHHQKTLGILLGLDMAEAVSTLELEHDQARANYAFEQKRVAVNAQGIHESIAQCETALHLIEERIQAVDAGQSILVDFTHLTKIREQAAYWTSHVVSLSEAEQKLLAEQQQIRNERDKTQRICQELREAIQFKVFLSDLVVERCPHCEQTVSQLRVEEEVQTKRCRVCQSELHPISSTHQHEIMLMEAEQRVTTLGNDLKKVSKEIEQVITECKAAERERAKYQAELQDLSRQERAGFTVEMRDLLEKQGYLRGQLQQLQEQSEENHTQRLKSLKDCVDILGAALTQLQSAVKQHYHHLLKMLEERTTNLAQLFGIPNLESIFLNERFDLFITQTGRNIRFVDMEKSETLRLKIAFHLALLTLRLSYGVGRHPELLIVDAPGSAEMDEKNFGKILQGFLSIKEQLGDQVQILIASTRDELAAVCETEHLEQREEGVAIF